MDWRMITDYEMSDLAKHQQYFEYSEAYRSAASTLCLELTEKKIAAWANAAVVLMLTAHVTELFLKGTIYFRNPEEELDNTHSITDLSSLYKKYYPQEAFEWTIPFLVEFPNIPDSKSKKIKEEIKKIQGDKSSLPSIRYRFPEKKGGKRWEELVGFEPNSFLNLLNQLEGDFQRIKTLLSS
jgi:hypothetical protein